MDPIIANLQETVIDLTERVAALEHLLWRELKALRQREEAKSMEAAMEEGEE